MIQSNRNRYLSGYSRRDLDAPLSRPITRWIVRSLGLIIALLIVSGTVAFWIRSVQKARLEASPLAKSLWIGQPGNADKILTEEKLASLKTEIAQAIGAEDRVTIHRFSRVYLAFQFKDQNAGVTEMFGRTVEAGDPILSRLQQEPLPDTVGIVPTRELLVSRLGYAKDETPEKLQIRFGPAEPWVAVPVLFVAEVSLPYEMKFLLRQKDYAALHQQGHEESAQGLQLGPIGEDWPTKTVLNRDALLPTRFSEWGIKTPTQGGSKDRGLYYELRTDGQPQRKSHWRTIAQQFREEMLLYLQEEHPDIAIPENALADVKDSDFVEVVKSAPPDDLAYDLAEVRVQDLLEMKSAAEGCKAAGYAADEALVEQVDHIIKVGLLLLVALGSITLCLLLIAFVIMYVVQKLRCDLKTPEIGMLKGMGISRQNFLRIFWVQALEFWWRSLLWGGLVALLAIGLVAMFTATNPSELQMLAGYFALMTVGVGFVAWLVIYFSLRIATREARTSDPMDTIRLR